MSGTPRTDERVLYAEEIGVNTRSEWVNAPFARGLERELNAAEERIKQLRIIISRASCAFFNDGSDGQVAANMLKILDEVKEANP